MTDEIYEWLRKQPRGTIFGVKGASHDQQSRVKLTVIDKFPHKNKPIPGGLELRILDTNQFKGLFHWRLTRAAGDTQRILFDAGTDNEFVRELLAEELRKKRNGQTEWVRVRTANHYLDCSVYAMAAADAEWQPSLKLLSKRIKQIREGAPQEKQHRRVLSRGIE
jgi:phage terminase large subunit GpA-like protein